MKANYLLYKLFNTHPSEFKDRIKSGYKHYILSYPTTIILQTVAACNLPCRHCFINNYGLEIPDGQKNIMKPEDFRNMLGRIEKVVRTADFMMFSSFEALLNKHLFEMMDAVLEINPAIKFPFLSNSMLMTEQVIDELKARPVTEINISVDGLRKETVEKFKTGVDYDHILLTLKRLKDHGLISKVAVTFVAHQDNIWELPAYADFMNSLGVKKIYANNLMSFTGLYEGKYLYRKDGNAEVASIFRETIQRVRKNKQQIYLPGLRPKESGCTQPETLFINYNGDVAPCDYLAVSTPFEYFGSRKTSKPVIFGNVFKEDVLDIYRSVRAHSFRRMHRSNKLPEACDHCIDGYGLMCSRRKLYK
jgi:MoaA/NifB/PqqE/SkfB family radical SAM enzyme